jgi:hypothetical protein
MNLDTLLADAIKTRAFVHVAELNAGGWQEHTVDGAELLGPTVKAYIYDQLTGWTWCVAIPEPAFVHSVAQARENIVPREAIISAAYEAVSGAADGKPAAPVKGRTWEEQLAHLMALYAGHTNAWTSLEQRVGVRQGERHFIVVCYRKRGERTGLLRPAAVAHNAAVMPVTMLQDFLGQIERIDRKQHPERFA